MNKLPKVSVYLTLAEFEQQVEAIRILSRMADPGEELVQIRIEGTIGYHDLEKLKNE